MNIYNELYNGFPRQIGIPYRINCNTKDDFYNEINKYYKYKRVYASVYNYINNPYYIKNPPLFVEDGTYYEELDTEGKNILLSNFKEDPEQALKETIVNMLKSLDI